jgi:mitochondrial ornithine carrier protein
VRREGFTALYRGMSLPLAGTVLETATLFTANGYLKRYLSDLGHMKPGDDLPMQYVLLAGAGTGFCVSWVLTPIELVKCRLQVQVVQVEAAAVAAGDGAAAAAAAAGAAAAAISGGGEAGAARPTPAAGSSSSGASAEAASSSSSKPTPRPYRGPLDCLTRSIREEGVPVLYRGHVGTVLREVPGTACWFGAYETFVRAMTPVGKTRQDLPSWVIVTAGALGGMSYWTVMYPADTVKSVMQTMHVDGEGGGAGAESGGGGGGGGGKGGGRRPPQPSFSGTLMQLYRTVGLRGLYAGMLPTFLRAAPSNAVIFLGYEWAARWLGDALGIKD